MSDAAALSPIVSIDRAAVVAPPDSSGSNDARPRSLLDDPFVPQIVGLCRDMFPGSVTVEVLADPSEPEDMWLVFNVTASADYATILRRELEWHDKVEQVTIDRSGKYRLSVYPI